jgi:hypothetical protein
MKKGSDSEVVTLVMDRMTTLNTYDSIDSDDKVDLSWKRYKKVVPLFIPSTAHSRQGSRNPSPVRS